MMSLSDDKQADIIDAFNTTSRYLGDILNINNVFFDNMVSKTYPLELQLNEVNTSDTKARFFTCICPFLMIFFRPKRDDFDFEMINFLDGDVPRSTSYGVYISQLIRFARASSHVAYFNIQKLLKHS